MSDDRPTAAMAIFLHAAMGMPMMMFYAIGILGPQIWVSRRRILGGSLQVHSGSQLFSLHGSEVWYNGSGASAD